jgi:hypothetical protein
VFSITSVISFSLLKESQCPAKVWYECRRDDEQHPSQRTEDLGINTFHVTEGNLLLEDHLVQRSDEVGIEESTMEDGETEDATNELEVVQVLGIDRGVGVDLECVVVVLNRRMK